MKLIYKKIEFKARVFIAKVCLEPDTDDAWNLYNLVSIGDVVRGTCWRKISKDTTTGLVQNIKKKLELSLQVTNIEFDGEAECIRISGKVAQENKWCKMGSFQSLEIQAPKKITLIKHRFDSIHVKKLKEATDRHNQSRVAAIVMEEGMSHLFLLGSNTSLLVGKVEKRIGKKKAFVSAHAKQTEKFYQSILDMMLAKYQFDKLEAIVIGSPGFLKDNFFKFMQAKLQGAKSSVLKNHLDKFILVHTSSGFKHSVQEIMQNKAVQDKISSLSCFEESKYLDQFFEHLANQPNKVTYGYKTVEFSLQQNAIETILIADSLFRSKNISIRQKYVKLVDQSERAGINVVIFSSMNLSGQRLEGMTGVACILRYQLAELEQFDDEDEDDDINSDDDNAADNEEEEKSATSSQAGFDQEQLEMVLNGADGLDGDYGDELGSEMADDDEGEEESKLMMST